MRGNFALWTSWAFFGKDINDLNQDEIVENNEIIDFVENAIEWRFPIGTVSIIVTICC